MKCEIYHKPHIHTRPFKHTHEFSLPSLSLTLSIVYPQINNTGESVRKRWMVRCEAQKQTPNNTKYAYTYICCECPNIRTWHDELRFGYCISTLCRLTFSHLDWTWYWYGDKISRRPSAFFLLVNELQCN